MELGFFVKGAMLGFAVAAPVGPIGLLCIHKTLQFGRLSGLFSGLGAAVADTLYGVIAAFGLTFISNTLMQGQFWIRLTGGVFLLYLGGRTFLSKSAALKTTVTLSSNLFVDFITTLLLTLTNPLTILSFLAIFAGLGLSPDHGEALRLVSGVFVGSCFWWILLSEGVTLFRKQITAPIMVWVNRIAGLLILGFGIMAFLSLL